MTDRMQWEINVPIFKNRYILKGLAAAIGIPFGILIAVILIASGGVPEGGALYALILIAALLILTFIFVMVIYGGKYAAGFILDGKGVTNYTQARQRKKNKIINGLTVAAGLASGNFTAAGAGMMANSRQVVLVKWKEVRKLRYDGKRLVIYISGGFAQKVAVFCTPDNYGQAAEFIKSRVRI